MIVPGPARSPLPRESANVRAEQVLGPQTAKRLATFGDGVLYVKAGGWAQFLAWLVDFVVFVFVLGVGVGVLVVAGVGRAADLDNGVLPLGLIAVLNRVEKSPFELEWPLRPARYWPRCRQHRCLLRR